ncbi:hypothetical protein [Streptomyces sp. NRRL S-87]|uniref:hypothetical protein n=1 Tax=Streptomyces sp. NRRL S-87 TaxID=1463920 RepID=UPI0004C0A697|nr:hypothetical protein [Streptomyces sp. NRRL S-87]
MAHEPTPGAAAEPPPARDPQLESARLKERLYAAITMIAVAIGLAVAEHTTAPAAAASVGATSVGLWLATLVADAQAHRVVHGSTGGVRELRRLLFVSSPLLLSAVGPLVLIGAAGLGLMALDTALLTSAGVNVAGLFAWGCSGALKMGGGTVAALVGGAVDAAIGTLVALVKAAGH